MSSGSVSPGKLTAALKDEAQRLGFQLAGAAPAVSPPSISHFRRWLSDGFAGDMNYLKAHADAYEHPRHVLEGVKSILMLGLAYRTVEPVEAEPGQAVVSRYAWGTDYHEVIHARLRKLADFHRQLTPQAVVRGVVDTAPLLERQFAQLAGLGWIGKNTCLLNSTFGSWLFLAAMMTSEELEYDRPHEGDPCAQCRACLDACPTGALVEPRRLDARKCISYLTIELRGPIPKELRKPMGSRVFGCDRCQEVCPWNRRAPASLEASFQPGPGMNPVTLSELFASDEDAWRARFRHTPLWRAKRDGILRNAAVALHNQGSDTSQ